MIRWSCVKCIRYKSQMSLYCSVYRSETLLEQEHMWAGLDCVCEDLIGWWWFAIGWSHVSDSWPRPHHERREEILREELILIQHYQEHEFNTIMTCTFIINTATLHKNIKTDHFDFKVTLNEWPQHIILEN